MTILFTSVVRSSTQGNSHGGIHQLDSDITQVFDHHDQQISWEGHGGMRGLRGIATYKDYILAASSVELFFFDQDFNKVKSFRNPNLKNNHSALVHGDLLYLTCTSTDCILIFDLISEKFIEGISISWPERPLEVFKGKSNHPGSFSNLENPDPEEYYKYFFFDRFDFILVHGTKILGQI